ncbi:serine/threonine protein kinase [Striga asiatica]|uniref:Serine/threonine protein kinase n=1 Tax=Striga asiatica TaxID=4170 RepID=A0A5A7P7T5_STRAF|nr:serine/threonine protein kinase [Striga asiatica]
MGRTYSANSNDYKLLEEVGYGASATVYRAIYLPSNEVVAVKCLDLDRCNSNLDDIRKEAQTMSLIDHPNVIKAFCSFVVDRNLWVVMPFMAEGSCLHLMKIAYPDGFEESAIGSILKETLKALEYLHQHGHIHRDVKASCFYYLEFILKFDLGLWIVNIAGNILMDSDGEVKLADFGVSACMADIWSFGITALELAHGHAPFSKYPPMKVLLMTIQNAPPGLDYDRDKRFSKSFKEMVAMCLVKDQTKRPTAEKNAKPPELSVKNLFVDLPPLWKRVRDLQLKDAAQLALKKLASADQEAISQSEYQRGVSAWNFDIEDLKHQASLLQDEDEIQEIKEEEYSFRFCTSAEVASSSAGKTMATNNFDREKTNVFDVPVLENQTNKGKVNEDAIAGYDCNSGKSDLKNREPKPELPPPVVEKEAAQAKTRNQIGRPRQTQSGPLVPAAVLSHSQSERAHNFERCEIENHQIADKAQSGRKAPSFSGPLNLPNRASANSLSAPIKSSGDSLDDKSKTNLVQIKGRFSVTSENVDLVKGSPLRKSASVGSWIFDSKQMPQSASPKEIGSSNGLVSILMPHLQNLFQQTSIQQDIIMNLLSSLHTVDVENAPQNGKLPPLPRASENNGGVSTLTFRMEILVSERERMLLLKISELQARMNSLTDELTAEKLKYMQLQQRLNAATACKDNGDRRGGDS